MNEADRLEEALGMLECASFPAVVAASDAMLKSYAVELLGFESTGNGLVTAKIWGDVAQVQKAIELGVEIAEQVGQVVSLHVVASPHSSLRKFLYKS